MYFNTSLFVVYFEGEVSSLDQVFTEENQNSSLCETVSAENNEIFEDIGVYNVSISTRDTAVELSPVPTSILVFDDDGELAVNSDNVHRVRMHYYSCHCGL